MIRELLENKIARERASIKAKEMKKLDHAGTYKNSQYGVKVEIKDFKEIKGGGVEMLARAWKGTEQVGFSKDGSVEWERFRIFNPPILVDDPTGDIKKTWTDENGVVHERTLREDPVEAVRRVIAHNVALVGKDGANITAGKIGNTTSTFFPDADPESTSVDGRVYRTGIDEVWGTIRAGAGTASDDALAITHVFSFIASATTNQWEALIRYIALFDTSSIGDTDTIDSATVSFVGESKADPSTNTPNVNIFTSTPASNTGLVAADYGQIGTTIQATAVAYASLTADSSTYTDFTLNATGLSNISKTGVTKFGAKNENYDNDNVAPTWSASQNTNWKILHADTAGTSTDPKLVVVHTTPPTTIKTITGIAKASVKTVNGVAIASVKTINGIA